MADAPQHPEVPQPRPQLPCLPILRPCPQNSCCARGWGHSGDGRRGPRCGHPGGAGQGSGGGLGGRGHSWGVGGFRRRGGRGLEPVPKAGSGVLGHLGQGSPAPSGLPPRALLGRPGTAAWVTGLGHQAPDEREPVAALQPHEHGEHPGPGRPRLLGTTEPARSRAGAEGSWRGRLAGTPTSWTPAHPEPESSSPASAQAQGPSEALPRPSWAPAHCAARAGGSAQRHPQGPQLPRCVRWVRRNRQCPIRAPGPSSCGHPILLCGLRADLGQPQPQDPGRWQGGHVLISVKHLSPGSTERSGRPNSILARGLETSVSTRGPAYTPFRTPGG